MTTALETRTITLGDGLTVGYRELGSGPPVLLLHGWPTSSWLWRRVMPRLAEENRVVALDLPGFGASAKALDVRYDFDLFEHAIDGAIGAPGYARGEKESVGEALPVRLHERDGDLAGTERGACDLASAVRRAVAA